MIKKMRAIEYNTLKTLIKLLIDNIPVIAKEYGIVSGDISVIPSYPADLTSLEKPSIIVRKVDTRQSKIGLGNILGQYFDESNHKLVDIVGKRHDMMYQFDVVASNSTDRALLESMISDDIFNLISYKQSGRFPLYDFLKGNNNIEEIGTIQLVGDPTLYDIDDKDSSYDNYIGFIRQNFVVIQNVVLDNEYVDLSNGIKQSFKIKF